MKLTVLVDNNTLIDKYFYGEPGLCFFIEEGENRILFDTGYSDVFFRNASKMDIDIKTINYIVLSHGHIDHTRGISHLIDINRETKEITLLAHPAAFFRKEDEKAQIGMIVSPDVLKRCFNVVTSKTPVWLSERMVFLGEIERVHEFENNDPIGTAFDNGMEIDDYLLDDSALVYKSDDGLVIITGCSHSGICNIIDYAIKVCEDHRIVDIIGGLHLMNPEEKLLKETMQHIKKVKPFQMHPCHCTDLMSKIALSQVTNLSDTGVGFKLEYE